MFCPQCLAEYIKGIERCPDCNLGFVAERPEPPVESLPDFVDYEEVLVTFNPIDIAMIHSMLDEQGIDFYFHGESFNNVNPVVQPSRLMVRKEQVASVKEILKDLEIRFMIPFK